MRRSALLLASAVLAVLLASGVAWAATIQCPQDEYSRCVGTGGPDTMYGTDDEYGYGTGSRAPRATTSSTAPGATIEPASTVGGSSAGGERTWSAAGTAKTISPAAGDRVYGGRGGDSITGEGTFVNPAPGDLLVGGPGDDRLEARDGRKDRIYCGTGIDSVDADNASKSWPDDSGIRDFVDDSCEDVTRY